MFCPRCGTVVAAQAASCARCGGTISRPDGSGLPEPVIPRAPTHRGELAQRAAGIVPTVLARPTPPRPNVEIPAPTAPVWPPPPAASAPIAETDPAAGEPAVPVSPPGEAAPGSTGPAPAHSLAWPPPPAAWDPAVAATWSPPSGAAPGPAQWAPPNRGSAPAWGRPRLGLRRREPRSDAYDEAPPTYFWQSIASLILLPPMGLVAVIWSLLASRRSQSGDRRGAVRASLQARIWCMATLVVFAGVAVISAVLGFAT